MFVVGVLMDVFGHDREKAHDVMMACHENNRSVVGSWRSQIAETKVERAESLASKRGFPLMFSIEEK
jgi:ATP-dependent Clp protease adaptor protein ClpS